MKLVKRKNTSMTLEVSEREVRIFSSALNETFEAVEEWEFSSRIGVDVNEAKRVQQELCAILRDEAQA